MNEGWLELESDPGIFTLLLEDFGVQGVQVEEVYDLQTKWEGPVYGFIFLFKWIEERRSRRKLTHDEESYVMDEDLINSIFFPKQIINNSCATHALLSVLMNCSKINLGSNLTHLKAFTKNMNAEDKGLCISNMPDLARAHNSHARPEPYRMPEKQQGISVRTGEAFHFVSYVPINGRLFELDGLQPYPVDHGPWGDHEDWTEHFRRVIAERLGMTTNGGNEPYHDIRYNLMAVVPDKRVIYEQKLNTLITNRNIIVKTLQQMVPSNSNDVDMAENSFLGNDLNQPIKEESKDSIHSALLKAADSSSLSLVAGNIPTVRTSARLRAKGSTYSNAFASSTNTPNTETESVNSGDSDSVFHKISVKVIDREETDSDVDIMDDASDDVSQSHSLEKKQLQTVENSDVKFHISFKDENNGSLLPTTIASTDITRPLSIETKFGVLPPGPGTGSSTDTASEIGSCLSSPVCSLGEQSPNVAILKSGHYSIVKIKKESPEFKKSYISNSEQLDSISYENVKLEVKKELKFEGGEYDSGENISPESYKKKRVKLGSHHGFTPKDLLQLMKNVDSEIASCEHNLQEEKDKYEKFKIDDCRRVHSYDQFICTFLSMLAEQGHLADLVEQQTVRRKSLSSVGNNSKKIIKNKPKKRR